jgi:hypothetical protein
MSVASKVSSKPIGEVRRRSHKYAPNQARSGLALPRERCGAPFVAFTGLRELPDAPYRRILAMQPSPSGESRMIVSWRANRAPIPPTSSGVSPASGQMCSKLGHPAPIMPLRARERTPASPPAIPSDRISCAGCGSLVEVTPPAQLQLQCPCRARRVGVLSRRCGRWSSGADGSTAQASASMSCTLRIELEAGIARRRVKLSCPQSRLDLT